jgi:hypothetical protein
VDQLKTELVKFELIVRDETNHKIGTISKTERNNVLVFNSLSPMDNLRLQTTMSLLNKIQKEFSKQLPKFSVDVNPDASN